jgi:anti-sigma B factor antagonist
VILVNQTNGIPVVQVEGDTLDATNSDTFKEEMSELVREPYRVVFDMTNLRFVDSAGLGAVLSIVRKLREHGGDLVVAGVSKPVRVLFEIVRLHKVVHIFDYQERALASFDPASTD